MSKASQIARVAAFLAGLVLIHLGLRGAFYAVLARTDPYLAAERALLRPSTPVDTLVMGDSYAGFAVHESALENTAKLWQLGEGYLGRYYRLRDIAKNAPGKTSTIILPLNAHQFSEEWGTLLGTTSAWWNVDFLDYASRVGFTTERLGLYLSLSVFPYADSVPTLYSTLPRQRERVAREQARLAERRLSELRNIDRELAHKVENRYGSRPGISPRAVSDFRRVMSICRENGLRVILVRYPISRQYYDALNAAFSYEQMNREVERVVAEWPEAVVLDYQDLFFERSDLFFDTDHLNPDGQQAFTAQLKSDLERLGLIGAAKDASEATPVP